MPIIKKANALLSEFAIFPVEPESQASLVESAIQNIESNLKGKPGFVSGTVLRSRDGLRVTSYVQWTNQESYIATQPLTGFSVPDVHLFDIFASEPSNSVLELKPSMNGLINFGIFKMKQPENQTRFVELFRQALEMVSGQSGLISTHAHRSLDGWRCINFGHWNSLEEYTTMDENRPFSSIFEEMLDLANNEYQKTLHEVVFTT
ncbi:MAG: antibiotic biosynthesis monooxygenase [Scytonematopsis contorta HA4267-MV1]|jgi:heme-degrading monooxygenase HmoA|nr:antibiotic biosynthesis monooxygenase [Scytonematopsis contorta HA4267-MV1]